MPPWTCCCRSSNPFTRPPQLFLALAHPVEPLRDVPHFGGQLVGVHAERLEPAAQLEEAGEVVLQGERLLHRAPQLLDLAPEPLRVVRRVGELGLGAPLYPGDGFGLFVEGREHGDQALQRLDAPLELAHGLLSVGDRLRQLAHVLRGVPRGVHQRLEGDALPLHLRENGAQLGGELLRRDVFPEQLPRGHDRPHVRKWCSARTAQEPGRGTSVEKSAGAGARRPVRRTASVPGGTVLVTGGVACKWPDHRASC
jgi:hypothetical protein